MLQPPMFRFGIELELLLEYREQKQYKGWQEFADELSRKLNEVDIDNHVDSNNIKKYSQWAITRDVSIQGSPRKRRPPADSTHRLVTYSSSPRHQINTASSWSPLPTPTSPCSPPT